MVICNENKIQGECRMREIIRIEIDKEWAHSAICKKDEVNI